MSEPLIKWKPTNFGNWTGKRNGIRLFLVARTLTKNEDGRNYELRTTLPVPTQSIGRYLTEDQAKDAAELFIVSFIERIGARFND